MKNPHSLKFEIHVLLESAETWLTGWPRSHYDATLVEGARNAPFCVLGKAFHGEVSHQKPEGCAVES